MRRLEIRSGSLTATSAFTSSTAAVRRRYTSNTVSEGEKETFTLVSVAETEGLRFTERITWMSFRANSRRPETKRLIPGRMDTVRT